MRPQCASAKEAKTRQFRSVGVLIADDHPIVREGSVTIINHETGSQVVAEASNWPEAIEKAIADRAELLIVDLHMPGMEATDAIAAIQEKSPASRIIVLTAFEGDEAVYRAIRAGAKVYLSKEAGIEALRERIGAVLDGKTWIHPSAASQLAARLRAPDITSREIESS